MVTKQRVRVKAVSRRPAQAKRNFGAASSDRLSPFSSGVGNLGGLGGQTGPAVIRAQLPKLIAHARHLARNSDHAAALEMMHRRHVIGPVGVRLMAEAMTRAGEADKGLRELVEAEFAKWGKRGNPTICGGLSFRQVQKMVATMRVREGNFLAIKHFGRNRGPWGFQLEPVEFDRLAIDRSEKFANGNRLEGGIMFNADGRRISYLFRTGRPGMFNEIPAGRVMHVFDAVEPGQQFGVPLGRTGMRRLNQLEQFDEAAIAAAIFGASKMAFLKRDKDFDEDIVGGAAGELEGEAADDGDELEGDLIPTQLEAGSILDLPPGVSVENFDPTFPATDPSAFARYFLKAIAASSGVSYAGLSGDLENANYSSLRDGRGEERDEWRVHQGDVIEQFLVPVFESWLYAAELAGRITGGDDVGRRAKAARWQARGWQAVSPKDEAAGNQSDLDNGLRSKSDIAAARGEDFEDIVARRKRDAELEAAAGLPSAPPAKPAAAAPDKDDDE